MGVPIRAIHRIEGEPGVAPQTAQPKPLGVEVDHHPAIPFPQEQPALPRAPGRIRAGVASTGSPPSHGGIRGRRGVEQPPGVLLSR